MQRFWLRHWGHGCPKRTCLWSLSPAIRVFDQGSLKGLQRQAAYKSAVVYTDAKGKRRYKGSARLKSTGTPGCSLAHVHGALYCNRHAQKILRIILYTYGPMHVLYLGERGFSEHVQLGRPDLNQSTISGHTPRNSRDEWSNWLSPFGTSPGSCLRRPLSALINLHP